MPAGPCRTAEHTARQPWSPLAPARRASQPSGETRHDCRAHPGPGGHRFRGLPLVQPVVVDADRLELALHRPDADHHLLDHRRRLSSPWSASWPSASSASGTARGRPRITSRKTSGSNSGSRWRPRSASPPCWRRACSSGASSSPSRMTRRRSRSSASNGSWSFRLPGKDGRLGTSDVRADQRRPTRSGSIRTTRPGRTTW